jgi:hypothetical protein
VKQGLLTIYFIYLLLLGLSGLNWMSKYKLDYTSLGWGQMEGFGVCGIQPSRLKSFSSFVSWQMSVADDCIESHYV